MQKAKYKDNLKSPQAFHFLKHLSFKKKILVIPIGYPRGITDGIFIINFLIIKFSKIKKLILKKKPKQVFFSFRLVKSIVGFTGIGLAFTPTPMQAFILVKPTAKGFYPTLVTNQC
jgi:hypothetical protein